MTTPKDGSVSSVIIDPEADNTIPQFANHDQLIAKLTPKSICHLTSLHTKSRNTFDVLSKNFLFLFQQ